MTDTEARARVDREISVCWERLRELCAQRAALQLDARFNDALCLRIFEAVADGFAIPSIDILRRTRKRPVVTARHFVMWILRRKHGWGFAEIARVCNSRDHGTALHGVRSVENLVRTEPKFAALLARIQRSLS